MSDYVLNRLMNKELCYQTFYNHMQYFFVEMKRDFIIQLFLAVMWEKYFDKCTAAEKADILQTIFGKKPSLGDFVAAARLCAKYCPDKKEREKLNAFFQETSKVIFTRNQADHKLLLENQKIAGVINEWIAATEEKFHYFSSKKNGYTYSFLIPQEEAEEVLCARINENGIVDSTYCRKAQFKGNVVHAKMLYYHIKDPNGREEIYRLSPFIHYFGREVDGIFTLYSCSVGRTHCLETEARSIFDDQINDSSDKNILSSKICRHVFEIKDFLQPSDDRLFYISAFCNTKINKSSYVQFQAAVDNSYKYNESIVKTECRKVYDFCKSKYEQIYTIAGPGGLGKTALLLNVVQKILRADMPGVKYDKVIFLSAKNQFLTLTDDKKNLELSIRDCDIRDLASLKYKMALYLAECEPDEGCDLDDFIRRTMAGQMQRSVLLMLDDLDSLGSEVQDDVLRFLKCFSPTQLKTIITTRSVDRVGNAGLVLERLDEEKCEEFVRWFVKTYIPNMENQFEAQLREEEYRKTLAAVSGGIPIFIEKWIEMSKFGEHYLEIGKRKVFTQRDCIRYLYNTTLNNLDRTSMQLVYLMKEICRCTGQREFNQDFLYFVCSAETEEELRVCLKRLIDMCLIMSRGSGQYELFDFDYEWIALKDYGYYQTPVYQVMLPKLRAISTSFINPNTMDVLIESLKACDFSEKGSNLILDKLHSQIGSKYCNVNQSRELESLRREKDSEGTKEQMSAVMLGDWTPGVYEPERMLAVFQKMEEMEGQQEAKTETFERIVECCLNKMDSIFDDEDGLKREYDNMMKLWGMIRGFLSQEKIEALEERKASFKEVLDETFEDIY